MLIDRFITNYLRKIIGLTGLSNNLKYQHEDSLFCIGQLLDMQVKNVGEINALQDVEFKIYSQWGDDGIISWLTSQLESSDPFFVEFGVQTYEESNTRFLLQRKNWSGLVIDGDKNFIDFIKKDRLFWKHNLKAENLFITKSNIDSFLATHCPKKDIELLSIDIDGNDYWIFEAIVTVKPKIIICEYNALFGNEFEITVPYNDSFIRGHAHFSNLYFGASINALIGLANRKGYEFIGTNSNGNNAYFVRNDLSPIFAGKIKNKVKNSAKFRESRNENGELSYLAPADAIKAIKDLPVIKIGSQETVKIEQLFT